MNMSGIGVLVVTGFCVDVFSIGVLVLFVSVLVLFVGVLMVTGFCVDVFSVSVLVLFVGVPMVTGFCVYVFSVGMLDGYFVVVA